MTPRPDTAPQSERPAVNSEGGWWWFFLALFLASFVGGGVRTLFSPRQLQLQVENQIEKNKPPFHLRFDHIELSLRNGWAPRFGIELFGVEIEAKDLCKWPVDLRVEKLYLPFEVISASRAKLYFKTIQASRVFIVERTDCIDRENNQPNQREGVELDIFSQATQFIQTRWQKEMAATHRLVRGLDIDSLVYLRNGQPSLEVNHFNVSFKRPEEFYIVAEIILTPLLSSVPEIRPFQIESRLNQSFLQANLLSRLNEGSFSAQLFVQLSDLQFKLEGQIKDLPLKPIARFFDHVDFGQVSAIWPRYSWLHGSFEKQGQINKSWQSISLEFSDWKFDGDQLNGRLKHLTLLPFTSDLRGIKDLEIEVESMDPKLLARLELLGLLNGSIFENHNHGQFILRYEDEEGWHLN